MPSKDKLMIAPEAFTQIIALAATIGTSSFDATFKKSAGTSAVSDVAVPSIAPKV